jgi:hypothetical protein
MTEVGPRASGTATEVGGLRFVVGTREAPVSSGPTGLTSGAGLSATAVPPQALGARSSHHRRIDEGKTNDQGKTSH